MAAKRVASTICRSAHGENVASGSISPSRTVRIPFLRRLSTAQSGTQATEIVPVPRLPRRTPPGPLSKLSSSAPIPTPDAVSLLKSQPTHYIVALFLGRKYLLTQGDTLTVPRMRDVEVGDVLRLTRIVEVGSRDFTIRAPEPQGIRASSLPPPKESDPLEPFSDAQPSVYRWNTSLPFGRRGYGAKGGPPSQGGQVGLSPSTVTVEALVTEHTKGKMEYIVKFKKRKGYTKTIKHKGTYTKLKIGEINLGGDVVV